MKNKCFFLASLLLSVPALFALAGASYGQDTVMDRISKIEQNNAAIAGQLNANTAAINTLQSQVTSLTAKVDKLSVQTTTTQYCPCVQAQTTSYQAPVATTAQPAYYYAQPTAWTPPVSNYYATPAYSSAPVYSAGACANGSCGTSAGLSFYSSAPATSCTSGSCGTSSTIGTSGGRTIIHYGIFGRPRSVVSY
jgi:TolA-binding protein